MRIQSALIKNTSLQEKGSSRVCEVMARAARLKHAAAKLTVRSRG